MLRKFSVKLDGALVGVDGILRVKARIARIGTMMYIDELGKPYYEYRSEEQVKASLGSFNQLAILIDHKGMVTPENKDRVVKGLTSNVRMDKGWVVCDIAIFDSEAIRVAMTTHSELSCGYECDVVRVNGTWVDEDGLCGESGKSYDYTWEQRDIFGNHVALVPLARAGRGAKFFDSQSSVKSSLDSNISYNNTNDDATGDACWEGYKRVPGTKRGESGSCEPTKDMDKEKELEMTEDSKSELNKGGNLGGEKDDTKGCDTFEMDGKTYTVEDAKGWFAKFQESKEKAKTAGSVANAKGKKDSADEARLDAQSAQIESLQAELNQVKLDAAAATQAEVTARLALWAIAQPILKLDAIDASMTQEDIKKGVVKTLFPNLAEKIDASDAVYINTLWDIRDSVTAVRVDGAPSDTVLDDVLKPSRLDGLSTAQEAYMARIRKNANQ
ncbi:MAG: DUF2213 domain-containing protein [Waterburya sp.]